MRWLDLNKINYFDNKMFFFQVILTQRFPAKFCTNKANKALQEASFLTVCEQITDIDGLKTVFLCKLDWGGGEKCTHPYFQNRPCAAG